MTRDFRLLLWATASAFAGFAPLLSVVPLWAASGGAASGAVGATTGVMMGATVAVQLAMPRLLRVLTLRRASVIGGLLLGVPTFAYLLSTGIGWVLVVSAVRGIGFGMFVVAGSALVAELVPPERRGRGLGAYGVAIGVPQALLLPVGVWAAEHVGFGVVFSVAGAASVLGALVTLAIHESGRTATSPDPDGSDMGMPGAAGADDGTGLAAVGPAAGPVRYRTLAGSGVLLLVASCAFGGATSFVPLAFPATTASLVLLAISLTMTVGRWWAGVRADSEGVGPLLPLGIGACTVGTLGIALAAGTLTGALAVVVAMTAGLLYGVGFGALQNDTLVLMFREAGPQGHGTASAAWNIAYDGGTGAGSLGVGVVAQGVGLSGALGASALPLVAVLPHAVRRARAARAARA
ncbi:MFS transporter [Isoptericola chiayiensis]|uniref:MFS transporter n=1 Tax=Isoptericola chiayiensis TaxID=579446 RepID=A0ABP8YGA8_9MICO|nr:MFS transporter [Isoptericola chiayiensis]NOW00163.1 putative MFS family arabinose efflux permease [Isoptericola chiayiensis]